jgi:hypothetical protein
MIPEKRDSTAGASDDAVKACTANRIDAGAECIAVWCGLVKMNGTAKHLFDQKLTSDIAPPKGVKAAGSRSVSRAKSMGIVHL